MKNGRQAIKSNPKKNGNDSNGICKITFLQNISFNSKYGMWKKKNTETYRGNSQTIQNIKIKEDAMKYYLSDVPFIVKSWKYDRHENIVLESVYLGKIDVTDELDEACMDDLRNKIAEDFPFEQWEREQFNSYCERRADEQREENFNPHFEINER